jgi:hypothetical protein
MASRDRPRPTAWKRHPICASVLSVLDGTAAALLEAD